MPIWAEIYWRVHDLLNTPMENKREFISWVSPVFPSFVATRADLQSESTMMPSELAIFVHVRSSSLFLFKSRGEGYKIFFEYYRKLTAWTKI
ncbi:UNVERIFIED_CONTAM: hypothetical protein NCL1_56544 [Trichonephila clavipes]